MRHTPGPWKVENCTDVFTELGARRLDGTKAADNDAWQIADCFVGSCNDEHGVNDDLTMAEQEANARLIAAPPELLYELTKARGIVERWCHYQGSREELFDYYLGPIDAAIAKAKGETQ